RAGTHTFGRRAPARVDRAGDPARPTHPHPGRGDLERGYGDRAGDSGGAGTAHRRTHRVRHRPPAVDAAQGVAAVRDRGRAAGGERYAWGADSEDEREVSEAVRDAGRAGVNWGQGSGVSAIPHRESPYPEP